MNESHATHVGTFKGALFGFIVSILLTLGSYFTVYYRLFSLPVIVALIVSFGLLQTLVQLIFFLHLGQEEKPRWNILIFSFMLLVLLILVIGSLWIMYNLNYRMM